MSQKTNVPQDDIAEILNTINEALEDLGYVAIGYENDELFLNVLIEKE